MPAWRSSGGRRGHRLVAGLVVGLVAVLVGVQLLAAAGTGSAQSGGRSDVTSRPNILLVYTDDQTLDQLAFMPKVQQLLVDQGTAFRQAFAAYPLCCPARVTLYTGQHAHNHGVLYNNAPTGGYIRYDGTRAMPVALQQAGYHTAHMGKFLNAYGLRRPQEIPVGWDTWLAMLRSDDRYYGYRINDQGVVRQLDAREELYNTDFFADRAVTFLRERAGAAEPFFLALSFFAPHTDRGRVVPPARHRDRFADEPLPRAPSFNEADVSDKPAEIRALPTLKPREARRIERRWQRGLEALQAVDDAIERLISTLRETDQLNDTVVLFTSDNGYFHGQHRKAGGKFLPYDASTRVPLIMRGPGVPAGATRDTLVSNVDIAPTLLDFASVAALDEPDGRSLRPLLDDERLRWDRDLLIETGRNPVRPWYSAIRTPDHLYVRHVTGEEELYDMRADPDQLRSLHDDVDAAGLRRELALRLAEISDCAGVSCHGSPDATQEPAPAAGRLAGLDLVAAPGDRAVRLRWEVPAAAAEVIVRRLPGTRAPRTPSEGTAVYRGAGRTATATGVAGGTPWSFAAFAVDAAGEVVGHSMTTAVPDGPASTLAPPKVRSARAEARHHRVALTWTGPSGPDPARIVVRYAAGTVAPEYPGDGLPARRVTADGAVVRGLRPARRYSFTVFSIGRDGNVSGGAVVAARTPSVATSLTGEVSRTVVPFGRRVRITGTLVRAETGAPLPGRRVRLQQRVSDRRWRHVSAAITDADGTVRFRARPRAVTRYRLRFGKARSPEASTYVTRPVVVRRPVAARPSPSVGAEDHRGTPWGTWPVAY